MQQSTPAHIVKGYTDGPMGLHPEIVGIASSIPEAEKLVQHVAGEMRDYPEYSRDYCFFSVQKWELDVIGQSGDHVFYAPNGVQLPGFNPFGQSLLYPAKVATYQSDSQGTLTWDDKTVNWV